MAESVANDAVASPERLRLLAALLGMPEHDSLEVLNELRADHVWLDTACEDLTQIPLEHWQAEHTRLFVTGFPKTACPPLISAYHGNGLPSSAVEELAGFYQDLGLSAQDMPPDYLGTLLECWAYLIEQSNEDAVQILWGQYLEPWLSRFAGDLRRDAELKFYRVLGEQFSSLSAAQSEQSR